MALILHTDALFGKRIRCKRREWASKSVAYSTKTSGSAGSDYIVGMTPQVQVRRVYDPAREDDGQRVLVDRIWPRGLSKERADLDDWLKQIAPSTTLRKWYAHDPEKFEEFARRYRAELEQPEPAAAYERLRQLVAQGPVTLLTATKRSDISEAAVLADLLGGSSRH
jgi:uncharacterized protein YeaO (DUF488 family)